MERFWRALQTCFVLFEEHKKAIIKRLRRRKDSPLDLLVDIVQICSHNGFRFAFCDALFRLDRIWSRIGFSTSTYVSVPFLRFASSSDVLRSSSSFERASTLSLTRVLTCFFEKRSARADAAFSVNKSSSWGMNFELLSQPATDTIDSNHLIEFQGHSCSQIEASMPHFHSPKRKTQEPAPVQ